METKHLGTLNRLYRLCLAGERGLNTLAASVKAKGVKLLLKTYAQQRRDMVAELAAEIGRYNATPSQRASTLGIIHRGRISIFSTLTLGQENIQRRAINEALRGERVVTAMYKRALGKELRQQTRALLERQLAKINATTDELKHLRGEPGHRLVVAHFASQEDAQSAQAELANADFSADSIRIADVESTVDTYVGKEHFMRDATISGAVGGAFWGLLLGIGAGGFMLAIPAANPLVGMTLSQVAILSIVLGVLFGAIFGAILGYFIGVSIKEEDADVYNALLTEGSALLYVNTNRRRADEARKIMRRSKGGATLPDAIVPTDTPLATV